MKLWIGGAISQFGDAVTALALPLTAVVTLGATPVQMGMLGAAASAPNLLLGLFAGVWVDRLHRRPLMMLSQLGQAVTLGFIPAAALLDVLRMESLYLVAFVVGSLAVFSDAASFSVVPSLV
ncbi:MAG: MFS transporter, partial [Dehalococcoidia bacterium]